MNIIIFSGTTEGRLLSERLSGLGIQHMVCVATESGRLVMQENAALSVHTGRIPEEELEQIFQKLTPVCVIDATHPYAVSITASLQLACKNTGAEYLRVYRAGSASADNVTAVHYASAAECAERLKKLSGNILLTTGSKDLASYTADESLKERLYVRVLPSIPSIEICRENGVAENRIIAMYGPHTRELNEALIRQFDICHLVTKESGQAGGFTEKAEAAEHTGCLLHIIDRPKRESGVSVAEAVDFVRQKFPEKRMNKLLIRLIGIGPGAKEMRTLAAEESIKQADLLIGAARMLESAADKKEKVNAYLPDDVIAAIESRILQEKGNDDVNIGVLFSGDTGIYSGAAKLYNRLKSWAEKTEIRKHFESISVEVIPGISSFSYFAAKLGDQYSDIPLMSLHGKREDEKALMRVRKALGEHGAVYLLLSGAADLFILPKICSPTSTVQIGYALSYPEEEIITSRIEEVQELSGKLPEGLYIVKIEQK